MDDDDQGSREIDPTVNEAVFSLSISVYEARRAILAESPRCLRWLVRRILDLPDEPI